VQFRGEWDRLVALARELGRLEDPVIRDRTARATFGSTSWGLALRCRRVVHRYAATGLTTVEHPTQPHPATSYGLILWRLVEIFGWGISVQTGRTTSIIQYGH
jgi:hypothetical protein